MVSTLISTPVFSAQLQSLANLYSFNRNTTGYNGQVYIALPAMVGGKVALYHFENALHHTQPTTGNSEEHCRWRRRRGKRNPKDCTNLPTSVDCYYYVFILFI